MKLTVVTSSENGPLDREALEMADSLVSEMDEINRVDWDDESSDAIKALYDVVESPALLLTREDGSLLELWQGRLPTLSEIKYRSGGV